MKQIIFIIFLVISGPFLTACSDYKEIHEISFVSSMGIDYDIDTNEFEIFFYFINNINNVAVEYGLSEPEELGYIASTKATSINEGIRRIQDNSEVTLDFTHIETLFLTETFFNKENVLQAYSIFRNSHLFYPTFEILTTSIELAELYKIENMTESPSYYTIITGKKAGFDYQKVTFLDFANDILIPNYYVKYPKITISEELFKKTDKNLLTAFQSGYSFMKEDYTISSYDLNTYSGLHFLDDFKAFTTAIDDIQLSFRNYKCHKSLKNDGLHLIISYEIAILNNPSQITTLIINRLIKEYIINELNDLVYVLKDDTIDVFNISFLNNTRGKYRYHFSYQSIDIVYEMTRII